MWMCAHDEKYTNETSQKTETLILQLISQKSLERHTKKAQSKIFMYAKIYAQKHTLHIRTKAQNWRMNALANLANGACSIFQS